MNEAAAASNYPRNTHRTGTAGSNMAPSYQAEERDPTLQQHPDQECAPFWTGIRLSAGAGQACITLLLCEPL